MTMLLTGLLLFAGVHLVPATAPGLKTAWRSKLGAGGYKGTFSLLLLVSFGLMISGWRASQPELLFVTAPAVRNAAMAVIALAIFLLVISNRPSRIRRWIRHPQLTGVLLWALAHLSANGDNRSLLLFGGMALWSVLEIVAINHRDGPQERTEAPPGSTELVSVLIAAALFALLVAVHPYLSGMPIL